MIIGDGIMLGAGGETASIVVTAPTGSTVTCTTPGGVVLTATEVGGTWTFAKLKVYGTYTVTATDGTDTKTVDVLVDSAVQYDILISYKPEGALYWLGDECEDVTGGWVGNYTYTGHTITSATKKDNSIEFNDTSKWLMLGTNNKISFSGYSKLCIEYIPTSIDSNDVLFVGKGKTSYTSAGDFIAESYLNGDTSKVELSVSSLQNGYVSVYAYFFGYFEVTKIWLK